MKKIFLFTLIFIFVVSGAVLGADWQEKLSFNGGIYYTEFASQFYVDGSEASAPWPDYVQEGISSGIGYNVRGFYKINNNFSVGLGYDQAKGSYTEETEEGFSRISGFELVGNYMFNPMFTVDVAYASYNYKFEAQNEGASEPFYEMMGNGPGYKVGLSYNYELKQNAVLNVYGGYRSADISLTDGDYPDDNADFDMSGYFVGVGVSVDY